MVLAEVLKELRLGGVEILSGDASQMELVRIREFGANAPRAAEGTLFLVPGAAPPPGLSALARRERDAAFVLSASTAGALEAGERAAFKATVVTLPGPIPLDLGARIQHLLDVGAGPLLAADTIARARQDLVEDLVLGRFRDAVALRRRARSLGMDLDTVTTVLLVGFDDFERFYIHNERQGELFFQRLKGRILQVVRHGAALDDPGTVVTPHAEGALVLGRGPLEELGRALAAALRKELRFVPVAVAVGLPKEGPALLAHSYREAQMALQLRKRLRLRQRFVAFREVTGSALLQQIAHAPEIASLLEDELRSLRDAEYSRRPVLVETVAAYYDAGGSLKRAAAALGIHPKTLRYRLDRAEDILGPGALDGDKRLLYHLAARYLLWLAD
ncbi:MAG TPA: helix-turn-helix domain-containing protein [Trueperaceae bacterium]|nr:helix-turn-helix domain-containing protein [Trueperaceae bacterium]